MGKKKILIIIVVVAIIAIVVGAGYFIIDKINENKRVYQIEQVSEYKYFVLKQGEQYGVIDTTGKTLIDTTYDSVAIPNPSKDIFVCYNNEKGLAYNTENKQLFAEYNSVEPIELKNVAYDLPYEKSILKCEKNGKYGLIDFDGNSILGTEYDNIESFANIEGMLQIEKDGKVGIVNLKGTILVEPEYDTVISDNYYSEENGYKYAGYIVGNKNEDGYKYGYINYKGKLKLKLEYNDISRITEIEDVKTAYLITASNGQYGLYKNGKKIINNEYQAIEYDNNNNILIMQKGQKYGAVNLAGDIIIAVENTSVQAKGQHIYVENNTERAVYDSQGNKIDLDFNKTIMKTTNEKYKIEIVSDNNSNFYGVINNTGEELIKPEYLYIEYAFGDYFIVCGKNGKLGILDENGKAKIELKYDLVQKMENKDIIQTLIAEDNTTELYSTEMKQICSIKNAIVENKTDYIKVYSDTEINYYNNFGEAISSSKIFTNNTLFAQVKDGKWGYVNNTGVTKIAFQYEIATEFNDYGFAAVKKDGKWGCIDETGKTIVEPKYETDESPEFIGEYLKIQSGFGDVYYTNYSD